MNVQELDSVLSRIHYPNMHFISETRGDEMYIQGVFTAPCNKTGEEERWTTRKWFISRHATVSEVVQTTLKLVLTALEHEAREKFRYRGEAIFGPHFDVEYLVNLALLGAYDKRNPQ